MYSTPRISALRADSRGLKNANRIDEAIKGYSIGERDVNHSNIPGGKA
jgi:hypothetical protein